MTPPDHGVGWRLPERPIERLTKPLQRFLHVQSASGLVLLGCAALALAFGNSAAAADYAAFWETRLRVGVASFTLDYPIWYWVNDALMAIFFFVIGLEIKRELVSGELSDRRNVVLPVAAAAGGALLPAALYALLSPGGDAARGWAVPMATDIAFVVGCMALLGPRLPSGIKILMLSLAIVDDIFAVVVIAIFYTDSLHLGWLFGAGLGLVITSVLNRIGVRTVTAYVIVGAGVWLCTLKSGVHPTVAGVVLGLMTPASAWLGQASLLDVMTGVRTTIESDPKRTTGHDALGNLAFAAKEAISPLERLEAGLHPWVGFFIMPVFALANAAVVIEPAKLASATGIAVVVGLAIGKPVGILAASWACVRTGSARLPSGATWPMMVGASCLGGIGFTMALFIAALGLSGDTLEAAKSGVLAGSLISAVLGMGILFIATRRRAAPSTGLHARA